MFKPSHLGVIYTESPVLPSGRTLWERNELLALQSPLPSLLGPTTAWSPGPEAFTISCCAHSYLDTIEQAISEGDTLLIENIGETIDPVLDPLLGRNTIKKGK